MTPLSRGSVYKFLSVRVKKPKIKIGHRFEATWTMKQPISANETKILDGKKRSRKMDSKGAAPVAALV